MTKSTKLKKNLDSLCQRYSSIQRKENIFAANKLVTCDIELFEIGILYLDYIVRILRMITTSCFVRLDECSTKINAQISLGIMLSNV